MKPIKLSLNYGSLAGLLGFAFFLIYYYVFGSNPLGNMSWLSIWIPILFMYLLIKKFREEEREGFLSYREGFTTGLMFTFVFASMSGMLLFIYGSLIDSSWVAVHVDENLEALYLTKDLIIEFSSEADFDLAVEKIKNISLGNLALGDFQTKFLGGTIVALIMAAVLKKNLPNPPAEAS